MVQLASRAEARATGQVDDAPHLARRLHIAFPPFEDGFWTVGPIHLSSLLTALRDTYGQQIGLFAFPLSGSGQPRQVAPSAQLDGVIPYGYPPRWSARWAENWLHRHVRTRDVAIERALERYSVDAALCPGLSSSYGRIATMWWLTDFQHLHLPEMFDARERAQRTAVFLRSSKVATRIITMSDSVKRDFEAFAPTYAWKVRVLSPVSYISQHVYGSDPLDVARAYNLPEKFVYLPNQFWKHKNHELVLRAVRILHDRGIDVRVVCTGNLADYRHPLQASQLFHKLSVWGIRHQVIYLGLLTRDEVLALIRQSVCVLNPSLFEGWGYSVDEARSIGKRVLLSDIPAHRDQQPPRATYFDPFDPEDLAARLAEVWLGTQPGPDAELEAEARRLLPRRRQTYAEQFVAVAQEAIAAARA